MVKGQCEFRRSKDENNSKRVRDLKERDLGTIKGGGEGNPKQGLTSTKDLTIELRE